MNTRMRPGLPDAFLVLALISFCDSSASAELSGFEEAIIVSDSLGLSRAQTWRRLLHFESGEQTSSVLENSFFLSPEGRVDPEAELAATLSAYFQPNVVDDSHPRCRFPARYYWLSHQLDLPDYQLRNQCDSLEAWGFFEKTNSVSVLMVSGYLGNPASTFGHSLLKLNKADSPEEPSLFDPTVNFGAMVPPRENPILFIIRGLTGGYEAGFSDRYYYAQDLVYSRREFRDMWEFRLNLTEYERILLGLHIWEIVGRPYKYYFLDKNCGYRLAELLDLVIEEDLLDRTGWWYPPVDLFHRLSEINQSRIQAGQPKLITSVRYIPSARRKLYHALSELDNAEIRILNQLLDEGSDSIDRLLNGLAMNRQIEVLNGILSYYQYLDAKEGSNMSAVRRADQDKMLLARLQRPARSVMHQAVPNLVAPTVGFRPMVIGLGGVLKSGNSVFTLFTWSPYKQESVGHNIMEGDELTVANVEIGVSVGLRSVFMSRFDLVRLLNLSTMPMRIIKDRGLSWQLRIGVNRESEPRGVAYDGIFLFGVGKAWKATRQLTGFGLLNFELHTQDTFIRVGPEMRLLANFGSLRATVGLDLISMRSAGDFLGRGSWRILYRLSESQSIDVERRPRSAMTMIGISHYF